VRLKSTVTLETQVSPRRFSAGSSCGVCGTTGLDAAIARAAATRIDSKGKVDLAVLLRLPQVMRESQARFGDTGGIHAAALFDMQGTLESTTPSTSWSERIYSPATCPWPIMWCC
jgi:FdhD protein